MDSIEGTLIFAQESRFQLVDRGGVAHNFVLSHAAPAEPQQLAALQRDQARVRVSYHPGTDVLAHAAVHITLLPG